jgi:hypothetical protein
MRVFWNASVAPVRVCSSSLIGVLRVFRAKIRVYALDDCVGSFLEVVQDA